LPGNVSLSTEVCTADRKQVASYNRRMSTIASGNTIAEVASLMGDVARANILSALMDGRTLTAGELTRQAGVSASTTSGHLSKLAQAELIALEKQGRHRYYRLASPEIAHAIEALMTVAARGPKRHHPVGPRDEALRAARTCYDHIAGRLGVALTDSLCEHGHIVLTDGSGMLTDKGRLHLSDFGIDFSSETRSSRPLCRTCLDWSECRPHLAGRLGAHLLERSLDLGWLTRRPDSRALKITVAGRRGFSKQFRLRTDELTDTLKASES
jgi:DNA-binding transcriptional ArsR family regulator